MVRSSSHRTKKHQSGWLFGLAGLSLIAFYAVGAVFLDGYALDLGSLNFPTPRYVTFVAFWSLLGGFAAALLALAIARRCGSPIEVGRLTAQWRGASDHRFLIWTCGLAFACPLVIRHWLMKGAPLADDESAYRFAADLLASGRLWVASPPLKLFFDQNFMINDGRLYPVYFLGWPALLAFGVWIHAPGVVNPLLSALTVPPLERALRHFVGTGWSRAGVLLFLSAPFLQIAAATLLSHTSCLMALTWAFYMGLRASRADGLPRHHAGFAASLAAAFCIRPQSAATIGLPLVITWALSLRQLGPRQRRQATLAFVIPTVILAVLFLGSLWAQNGSPWRVGYARYGEYMVENGFRFTTFNAQDLTTVAGFSFSEIGSAVARTAGGMFRLNFDLFGWPSSFGFLMAAALVGSNRYSASVGNGRIVLTLDALSARLGNRYLRSGPRVRAGSPSPGPHDCRGPRSRRSPHVGPGR